MYDAVIIGGGAVGCAVARELSRWKLKICLAEQGEDVCVGTSKANSAIVHAGFDAPTGSMKARFNVEGSRRIGGNAPVDLVAQLAVHAYDTNVRRRLEKRQQLTVSQAEILIGHVRLEARDALALHVRKLGARGLVPVRHSHVEAVVTGAVPVGAAVPGSASVRVCPRSCVAKSSITVVPPASAAAVPDAKLSAVTVLPVSISRCV